MSLAHLQLLEGMLNIEKQATFPADWLRDRFPTGDGAANYRMIHALGDVPDAMTGFETFHRQHRELMRAKLIALLIGEPVPDGQVEAEAEAA